MLSKEYKKSALLAISIILAALTGALLSPFVYADNTVNSPLARPQPSTVINGDGTTTYTEFYVVQSDSVYLYEMQFTVPSSETCAYMLIANYNVCINCTQEISISTAQVYVYDVLTGAYLSGSQVSYNNSNTTQVWISRGYHSCYQYTNSYFPRSSSFVRGYPIDDLIHETSNTTPESIIADPFVIWSEVAPDTNIYRSYTSHPISDEYNRYLLLGNGDDASLLWFSFQRFEYQYINSTNPTNHIDGQIWSQTISLSNSTGLRYSMLFQTPSALDNISYLDYSLMISKFDLETGQYIMSRLYSNNAVSSNITIDLTEFYNPSDITDLEVLGMSCFIQDKIVNRLSCIWSYDPQFTDWQDSVENYLDLIYQALSQTAEEVTIATDSNLNQEFNSARSGLVVTDQSGNTIDAAAQVEVAFSDAAAGLSDLQSPIQELNTSLTSLYSEPLLLLPVIVALALGLAITILGKNKSD